MNEFIEHLHDLFGLLGPIRLRRMFGGHGLYHDDLMIALVIDDAIYLKTDEQTVPEFVGAGCAPFEYRSRARTIALSYWSVPEEAMDDARAMLPWARLARDAALRKANAPRKRKAGRTKSPPVPD
jgi:DNA transformation protein